MVDETSTQSVRNQQSIAYESLPEYDRDVHENPIGGRVVHRCHPNGDPADWFAFGAETTMSGTTTKEVYLYRGTESRESVTASRWESARLRSHVRPGSSEDCPVCTGDVDPEQLLFEFRDMLVELKRTPPVDQSDIERAVVYGRYGDDTGRLIVEVDTKHYSVTSYPNASSRPDADWVYSETMENYHLASSAEYNRIDWLGLVSDHPFLRVDSVNGRGGTATVSISATYPEPEPRV